MYTIRLFNKQVLRVMALTIVHFSLSMSVAQAQPSWVKKATKSVFTLKTFAADGSLIASSNGFFTGQNGEAVSSFSPFKGASRAIVIDAQGTVSSMHQLSPDERIHEIAQMLSGSDISAAAIANAKQLLRQT